MNLLPQDILVMVKLLVSAPPGWTYHSLAHDLGMSPSMAHSAVKRAVRARLFDEVRRLPVRMALEEFLVHGVKYAFPPDIGPITRGVPTAFASPGMKGSFIYSEDRAEIFVWPHPEGDHRGMSLSPLYRSVPDAVRKDLPLHQALGLIDTIRIGRAREQALAAEMLSEMIHASDQ